MLNRHAASSVNVTAIVRGAIFATVISASGAAYADDRSWIGLAGPDDPFWDLPANWALGLLPGDADNALIGAGFTAEFRALTGTVTVQTLQAGAAFTLSGGTLNLASGSFISGLFTMSGGTLGGGGILTVGPGAATWTAGSMSGTGTTTFNGTLAISGNGLKDISGQRTINTTGTTTWSGNTAASGNTIRFTSNSGAGANINNSGTWLDQNAFDASFSLAGGGTRQFNNSAGASYIKSGAGTTTINTAFNNAGTLEVQAGTLNLNAPFAMLGDESELILPVTGLLNDSFDVDAAASLDGVITLDFSFAPDVGEVITVFGYDSHTGTFDNVFGAGLATGYVLTAVYNADNFQIGVAAIPEPKTVVLMLAGLALLGWHAKRRWQPQA